MIGTIIGDIAGSTREFKNFKTDDLSFELFPDGSKFTDDTILTAAIADSVITGDSYKNVLADYANTYPHGGYGGRFVDWVRLQPSQRRPYNSFGNGSAMRVSAIAYAYDSLEEVLDNAEKSADVTHNHPEGIKGAQATAACIFLARTGKTKEEIEDYIVDRFKYKISTVNKIRPLYQFDTTCQGTVPQAIACFSDSTTFEEAIKMAVSLGGDADTIGAITGSIAEAFYGVPEELANIAYDLVDYHIRMVYTTFMDQKAPNLLVGKWAENKEQNLHTGDK